MRNLLFVSAVALAACGSSDKGSATVHGLTLHIQDSLYKSAPNGRFCQGFALDQVQLYFDDYSPSCYLDQKPGENPKDPTADHLELVITLAFGGNPTATAPPFSPFTFDQGADCTNGGANSVADFLHFPPGAMTPSEDIKADRGTITITRYDRMNKLAMTGNYDLFFGADEVKGTINALNCD